MTPFGKPPGEFGTVSPAMSFDKATKDSPFLSFTAAEFHKRGSQHRRDLSNKTAVQRLLKDKTLDGTRIGLPVQHAVLTSTQQINPEVLGDRVALKFAHGWSAKGVMLLERTGPETYFDHMALREWTLEDIRQRQQGVAGKFARKQPAWIVEDFLNGAQPGAVPYDYKFYTFQGQIAMVAQVDRNSSPPRVAMLDGQLRPLAEGRDYRLKRKDLQPGVALVPRSAVMLSRWAIELSKMTDAPFVRVDLYDGDTGPVFGEFTFSSGAEHRRTLSHSTAMIDTLDSLFDEAQASLEADAPGPSHGWSALLQAADPAALSSYPEISLAEYQRYAYFLHNQGSLGGYRLARAQHEVAAEAELPEVTQSLVAAHRAAGRRVKAQNKTAPLVLRHAARKAYHRLRKR
ncbi:hypothetical protein FEF27_07895 [Nesterenkonia sphaerica]|uniref:ATP-grasp domain-containing protein n=2 Tax=Nesterenkonia sphaerica TaxID=1804988 RepID=A0A5R9ACK9_9MICC|nr:hypothetical protein FEF27_07895 [Nesterenkonia sphaerica]